MHSSECTNPLDYISDPNCNSRSSGYGSFGFTELGIRELTVLIAFRDRLVLVAADLLSVRVTPSSLRKSFPLGRGIA